MGVVKSRKEISRSYGGIYIALFFAASILFPSLAVGDETSVTNTFSASSNTGGNNASNGEVVEGTPKSHVQVYTEVNGDVVTDIDEATTEGQISIDEETGSAEADVHTKTHIEVQAEGSDTKEAEYAASDESTADDASNEDEVEVAHSTTTSADVASAHTASEENAIISTVRTWVRNMITYVFGFFI